MRVCPVKLGKVRIINSENDNVTLELKKIKIKERSKWEQTSLTEFQQNEKCFLAKMSSNIEDLMRGGK